MLSCKLITVFCSIFCLKIIIITVWQFFSLHLLINVTLNSFFNKYIWGPFVVKLMSLLFNDSADLMLAWMGLNVGLAGQTHISHVIKLNHYFQMTAAMATQKWANT